MSISVSHRPRKPMTWMMWGSAVLLLCLSTDISWARGGGGCLAKGTLVSTPGGKVAIETLKRGDTVWSIIEGRLNRAEVQALTEVEPEEFLEVSASHSRLEVTSEHLLMVGKGEYRLADRLNKGDTVFEMRNGRLRTARILAVRRMAARRAAYNLLVSPGGTFVTDGLVVHNKGCFLPDSPILRPDGTESPISAIRPGEKLLAFKPGGRMVQARVREVIRLEADEYFLLKTDQMTLRVTAEHPFYVGNGMFKTVEALKERDRVFAWDGKWLSEQRIVSLQKVQEHVEVFNLQTDHPNTFFAGQLAVHNKGGGCFPAGTRIATAHGKVPIEALASGDEVFAVDSDGRTVRTSVKVLFISKSPVVQIRVGEEVLAATEEHPVSIGRGRFTQAGNLQPGNRILKWRDGRLVQRKVRGISHPAGDELVFNLQVEAPNTFIADGIVVHNKGGGCFPAGTPIYTPKGQTPIEMLSPGEPVLALDPQGRRVKTRVEKIFDTRSLVLSVETDRGYLRVTPDHPVGLLDGGFIPAGTLQPGQKVLTWNEGDVGSATVLRTRLGQEEEQVYNLSVGWPNTFLAASFVTHNKGGSSSHSSSSHSSSGRSSGSSGGNIGWILAVVISSSIFSLPFIFALLAWRNKRKRKDENLDFVYGREKIDPKAGKTEKLLEFLAQQDASVKPEELRKLVDSTFRKLQECWQARNYEPMKPLMMPDLYNQHVAQLQGMIRDHEIDRIENLKVETIDLVNVRYTEKPEQREFTALVTASARDYYVDDRSGKFLRGDESSARFQEFWTFHRMGDRWLLREIEQAGESDILKDENFAEMLTDETIKGIYGEVAKKKGETGPWIEKKTEEKATRVERLLNFLVQTDRLWDRNQMLERAREVFMRVYLAKESGDPDKVPATDLFPEVTEDLRRQILQWRKNGRRVEYRNLCVRKAELILVRNFADNSKDEYMVRISAHAQRISYEGNKLRDQQEYVTPFEEYWTFGRLENQWKLKGVLPSAAGKKMINLENVDEDSSAGQMQWYYRQSRAK